MKTRVTELLGIESGGESSDARRWREAASERWDSATATGGKGAAALKEFGSRTRSQAGSVRGKLSERISERKDRRTEDDG